MIGVAVVAFAFVALALPDRWAARLAPLVLLGAALANWFGPLGEPISGWFFGFAFEFNVARSWSAFVGAGLAGFGAASFWYLLPKRPLRWLVAGALIHIGSALALLTAGDLLSFFIFWELITIGAVMIIYQDRVSFSVLHRYFVYQMAGAAALLIGIGINYGATGSIALADIAAGHGFFLLAVAVKCAVIPLHLWLIRTYPRVTKETTVVLSAYATKVGVVGIGLLLPGYGLELAGGIVAVVAVLYALRQSGLRQFLSFHIISQIGYMIAGVGAFAGAGAALAAAGGYFHLVNNVVYKGLLFMVAGVLVDSFGRSNMYRIRGAGRRKPLLTVIAVIASASIAGVPPFNGFISKSLLKSALDGSLASWLLVLAGIGTAMSFTKFLYLCFFTGWWSESKESQRTHKPAAVPPTPIAQQVAMCVLALTCLALGLAPHVPLSLFFGVEQVFYYPAGLWNAVWPVLTAVLLFAFAFPVINRLLKTFLPVRLGLSRLLRVSSVAGGALAQAIHNGSALRYLSWAVSGLVVVWTVLLLL